MHEVAIDLPDHTPAPAHLRTSAHADLVIIIGCGHQSPTSRKHHIDCPPPRRRPPARPTVALQQECGDCRIVANEASGRHRRDPADHLQSSTPFAPTR